MTGLVDGEPVGRAWATLVTDDEGNVDFHGNTIDLFPQFRAQGLTRSFLGALRRHVREVGVRDVHLPCLRPRRRRPPDLRRQWCRHRRRPPAQGAPQGLTTRARGWV